VTQYLGRNKDAFSEAVTALGKLAGRFISQKCLVFSSRYLLLLTLFQPSPPNMEREFHAWLKTQFQPNDSIKVGIGDDAAVLAGSGNTGIVLASDAIAQGTHFDLAIHSLEQVGRKSIAVNLSDIAAMGATPVAALLT
jgi:hypothetical protein